MSVLASSALAALLDRAHFDERGLLPVVAQHAHHGAVLLLAYANAEALRRSAESGQAHFFSRSRGALWRKGETSGHFLQLVELRLDCDGDAALYRVLPTGPACHTGRVSCFFRTGEGACGEDDSGGPPATILDRLSDLIQTRRRELPAGSYVADLLRGGPRTIAAKIREESEELVAELPGGAEGPLVHEAADLLFHVLVGLGAHGVSGRTLLDELGRRFGTPGHEEKSRRPSKG